MIIFIFFQWLGLTFPTSSVTRHCPAAFIMKSNNRNFFSAILHYLVSLKRLNFQEYLVYFLIFPASGYQQVNKHISKCSVAALPCSNALILKRITEHYGYLHLHGNVCLSTLLSLPFLTLSKNKISVICNINFDCISLSVLKQRATFSNFY